MTEKTNIKEMIDNKEWKALLTAIPEGASSYPVSARDYISLKSQISKRNAATDCPHSFTMAYNFETSMITITKTRKGHISEL